MPYTYPLPAGVVPTSAVAPSSAGWPAFLYGHLWGPLPRRWRDHTCALLIAANRDPRCPEKVLGAVLAAEEEREGYPLLG